MKGQASLFFVLLGVVVTLAIIIILVTIADYDIRSSDSWHATLDAAITETYGADQWHAQLTALATTPTVTP